MRRTVRCVLRRIPLTVVLALVVVASASGGAPSPARILFQTFPYQGFDAAYAFGVANADGTGFVDLTASVVHDHHAALKAAWSPDGSAVAFTLYRSHTNSSLYSAGEIWAVDADGTNARQLTHDAAEGGVSNTTPVWSPDGSRIAWLKETSKGSDVWEMNADGSAQHALTADGATGATNTDLAWSSDGRQLAWLKGVSGAQPGAATGNVWVAHADGSSARALTSSSLLLSGPSWEPGGRLLLYVEGPYANPVLHIVDPAVGPPGVKIPTDGLSLYPYGLPPAWSPTGGRVAWGDRSGVEVATVTGDVRRVASTPAYNVAWSPDESKLAFVHNQNLPAARSVCPCASVYVVDTRGGSPTIVSGVEGATDLSWFDPAWWPDSARLSVGGEWGILNVNADGTCRRSFPNGSGASMSGPLLWQPGERALPPLPQCVALEGTGHIAVDTAPFRTPPPMQFTVSNRGNATAHEVTVYGVPTSGTISTATPGCRGGDTLRCTFGPLAGLASVEIGIDVANAKPGAFKLALTITSAERPPVSSAIPVLLLPCATAGDDHPNRIVGTPGRDTICGFGGDDVISGLGGNDWIDGGTESDTIHGGAGNDVILDDLGHDRLYGDAGNDMIDSGNGPDTIYGGSGNDHLRGGLYPDRLFGGPGDDLIDANDGYHDYVDCGPGYDTVVTNVGAPDTIKNCERVIRR